MHVRERDINMTEFIVHIPRCPLGIPGVGDFFLALLFQFLAIYHDGHVSLSHQLPVLSLVHPCSSGNLNPPSHHTEQSSPVIILLFMACPADITLQGNNSLKNKDISPLKKSCLFIFQAVFLCSLSCVLFLLHSSAGAMKNNNK